MKKIPGNNFRGSSSDAGRISNKQEKQVNPRGNLIDVMMPLKYDTITQPIVKNPSKATGAVPTKFGNNNSFITTRTNDQAKVFSNREPPHLRPNTSDYYLISQTNSYSTYTKKCKYDPECILSQDVKLRMEHLDNYAHSFKELCKSGLKCSIRDKEHKLQYSHICQWGSFCRKLDSKKHPKHMSTMIHIKLEKCSDPGCQAYKAGEKHLQMYFHENFPSFRIHCRHAENCINKDFSHLRKYYHPKRELGCPLSSLHLNRNIDFASNIEEMRKAVDKYFQYYNLEKSYEKLQNKIKIYLSSISPVHRCKVETLKTIAKYGSLVSKNVQDRFQSDTRTLILQQIMENEEVNLILKRINALEIDTIQDWIEDKVDNQLRNKGIPVDGLKKGAEKGEQSYLRKITNSIKYYIPAVGWFVGKTQKNDKSLIQNEEISIKLEKIFTGIIDGVTAHKFSGIGFEGDKEYETDKFIFSIVGDNSATYYGNVIIKFKQEIMYHPDFNMTPIAGFHFQKENIKNFLPWVQEQGVECFHKYKLNPCFMNWKDVLGRILFAKVIHDRNKGLQKFREIDIDDIKCYEKENDSHELFEGHLPEMIPMKLIDEIYIPEKVWDNELSYDEKKRIRSSLECEDNVKFYKNERDLFENYSFWKKAEAVIPSGKMSSVILEERSGFKFSLTNTENFIKMPIHFKKDYENFELSFLVKGKNYAIKFITAKNEDEEYLEIKFSTEIKKITFTKKKPSLLQKNYNILPSKNEVVKDINFDFEKINKNYHVFIKVKQDKSVDMIIDSKTTFDTLVLKDEIWMRLRAISLKALKKKVEFNKFVAIVT